MSDYIEREAAQSAVWEEDNQTDMILAIGSLPAADVAPVRHGRWYLAEDAVFRCSECGRICYELNAPYCYCGARMEKESEHETD